MFKKYIYFFNYSSTKKVNKIIFFKSSFLKKPFNHFLVVFIQLYVNVLSINTNIFLFNNLIILNHNFDLYEIHI